MKFVIINDELDAARNRIAELESENTRLERLLANATADHLAIARLLSDVGIEHSGYSNQAPRVEMLIAKHRKSQDYSIAFAKERNDARRRITELEEHLQFAVRLACSSTNHDKRACHGHLWVCSECDNVICCAEGTDDHPDVCDSCWDDRENH